MSIEWYKHHDVSVAVQSHLKGKHQEHCLCYFCANFHPEKRIHNCDRANKLFALCKENGMVTPVWECSGFYPKEETEESNSPEIPGS